MKGHSVKLSIYLFGCANPYLYSSLKLQWMRMSSASCSICTVLFKKKKKIQTQTWQGIYYISISQPSWLQFQLGEALRILAVFYGRRLRNKEECRTVFNLRTPALLLDLKWWCCSTYAGCGNTAIICSNQNYFQLNQVWAHPSATDGWSSVSL